MSAPRLDTTIERLLAFLRENYVACPAEPDLERTYFDQGILDSTGLLELISWIEQEYSFSIPDTDITQENFGGISRTAWYIDRREGE